MKWNQMVIQSDYQAYVIEIYWTISARLCPQSGLFVFNSDEKGVQESQARRLERKIWSC